MSIPFSSEISDFTFEVAGDPEPALALLENSILQADSLPYEPPGKPTHVYVYKYRHMHLYY